MERIIVKELKKFSYLLRKYTSVCDSDELKLDNFTQVQVVFFIGNNNREVNQKDIEASLGLTKSSVSSILDTLENKNIIIREVSKKDARKNIIKLSDKSLKFINQVEKNILDTNNKITKNIDKNKLNTFFEVLDLMNENLRKDDHNV